MPGAALDSPPSSGTVRVNGATMSLAITPPPDSTPTADQYEPPEPPSHDPDCRALSGGHGPRGRLRRAYSILAAAKTAEISPAIHNQMGALPSMRFRMHRSATHTYMRRVRRFESKLASFLMKFCTFIKNSAPPRRMLRYDSIQSKHTPNTLFQEAKLLLRHMFPRRPWRRGNGADDSTACGRSRT